MFETVSPLVGLMLLIETHQKRVSEHLDVNASPELISEIADAVHITKLKHGKYESEAMLRQKFGEYFTHFRQGVR